MTIDIRATVSCSLGEVISGSLGDDYIQGSGLIKTTGSVLINDLITPNIGTIVTFSYTKNGVTTNIPRKLRVKSSFADPFRRTTQVEFGCKLDYLSDLKDRIDWSAFDDPQNNDKTKEDARIVTIPIYASSVMNKCLQELGITASSNPLTNSFSIAEFDFSSGYVSILNDLLISESYCGYLDFNETLQVFSLSQDVGTGPVITADDIIDLSPIGVGNLPGEAVTVSYSTLKLKRPDPSPTTPEEEQEYEENIERINWERSVSIGDVEYYYVSRKIPNQGIQVIEYSGITVTVTETTYGTIAYIEEDQYKEKEVPIIRISITTGPTISKLSGVATQYFQESQVEAEFNNTYKILRYTEETYLYDELGNEIQTESLTYEPEACILASTQFEWVYEGVPFAASYDLMPSEHTIQTRQYLDNYSRTITSKYLKWAFTQPGSQAVSITKDLLGIDTYSEASQMALMILGGSLVHDQTTESVEEKSVTSQSRPPAAERTNAAYSKGGDPNNGWRTESVADLELAVGSATAQRRIEFSMPYAPDDIFIGPSGGPFFARASDAPAKANRYGRVQNRLLLGNRSGISVQLAPEKLPPTPFSPLYIQANGLTAQYRVNAANWAFDSNGIICSTDALFWGAVGGTGTFWFPVAPGVVTLPETPPVIDGQISPTSLILPYNETSIYDSRITLNTVVTKFNYSLILPIEPAVSIVKVNTIVQKVIVAEAGVFNLAGQNAQLLLPNRQLAASSGAFTLSGMEAMFFPPVLLTEPASFTLSGQDASLVKSLQVLTGTQAPLLGATGATAYTGWDLILDESLDDDFTEVSGWPITFTIDSIGYTGTFVGSNTYLTFGSGDTTYFISASSPNLPKIHFGAADNSFQRIYRQTAVAGDGSNIMRIRYEGTAATSGTPGSPDIVAEFSFFTPRPSGNQWIELRVGTHNATSGTFMIANASTSYASSTITQNSSWVFVGNSTGTSWTLTSNRYIG